MRVAVADLGSNSTRLLIADVADGRVDEVERLLEITRLGEGVDASGTLQPTAMARVLGVLDRFEERARAHGAERRVAVATSAVRDAANRDELLAGVRDRGFDARVLTGDEEAGATFAGVASDMAATGRVAVVDVGGGSTEVVLHVDGEADWSRSYAAGCVRMSERQLGGEAIDPAALARCRADLATILDGLAEASGGRRWDGVAVAGTATTAAAIELGCDPYDAARIHGHRIARATIAAQLARLAPLTADERRRIPGLSPDRAPVICAGFVVLDEVLGRLGIDEVVVSERDILHGVALQVAAAR
jgi:exopolyphosphatase/guanosine-5'-triphosphate,3'-diphosphate pyrophosphatase